MELTIHGENVPITEDLEAFVEDKLDKLNRYLPNIDHIHVELTKRHNSKGRDVVIAQITLRHSRGAILRTEERMEYEDLGTVRAALLTANDKMYRRIRRFKGKPRSKRMRENYSATQEEMALAEAIPEFDDLDVTPADAESAVIVRRKDVMLTAMNEEEAIEQMELIGHHFFMFYNADSNSVEVIYKRDNGGYGLLHPVIA